MKRLIISSLVALVGLAGCGVSVNTGSGGATSSNESESPTTSAAEVHELGQALRKLDADEAEEQTRLAACREETEPEFKRCLHESSELAILGIDEVKQSSTR